MELGRRPDNPTRNAPWQTWLPACLIVVLTVAAYVPAISGGHVWDDDVYVTLNPTLRSVDGLWRIWFEVGATVQYYPLVFTTFWIEYHLWGSAPLGYHLVNVLLHSLSAVLLWLGLRRLAVPGAWLAAVVFALHPVHTESVAWITERKNVLSGVLYLSAMLAYLRFCGLGNDSSEGIRSWRSYALALLLFSGALFSKTIACSLPAAILLLLWWKRDRITRRDILPLIPMFIIGLVMGLTTAWIEKHYIGAQGEDWELSFVARCLIAGRALWFYAGKLVWPADLTFFYVRWRIDTGLWWQYLGPLAAVALVVLLWFARRRTGKGPLVAALFFGGTLLPALGFVDVYPMRFSFVADHFQYLASIGLITLLIALGTTVLTRRTEPHSQDAASPLLPIVRVVLAIVMVSVLGTLTWHRGKAYENVETLWRDTIAKNPDAWLAHNNLGNDLAKRGDHTEAMHHFTEALRARPGYADAHNNLGNSLLAMGRTDEALAHYHKSLELDPDLPNAYNGLGMALNSVGKTDEAIEQLTEALTLRPTYAEAHNNLGLALVKQGNIEAAIAHYRRALQLKPGLTKACNNLANALLTAGRADEAVTYYRQALQQQPNYAEAHNNLGLVLIGQGNVSAAIEYFHRALDIQPEFPEAHNALGGALARQGNMEQAIAHVRRAIELKPNYAEAYQNLGLALARQGRIDQAVKACRYAVELQPRDARLHCNLGDLLRRQGQTQAAIRHYREALRLKPDYIRARRALEDTPSKSAH